MNNRKLVEAFTKKMSGGTAYNLDYWEWRMNEAGDSVGAIIDVFKAMEQDRVNHSWKCEYGEQFVIKTLTHKPYNNNPTIG